MFAIEWAMAALWRSWGVTPAAVIGHSTGQYVAAALAGVFDLDVGMALMAQRARLMSDLPKDGAMLACFASEERIAPYLAGHEGDVAFAAINGPAEAVISGRAGVVEALAQRIEADGIEVRRLNISHAAHSPLMDPILDRFERLVGEVPLARPVLPLVENVRGEVAGHDVISPRYWREHMRQPVRFLDGMRTLVGQGYRVFLELGNHPVLAGAGARCVEDVPEAVFLPSLRRDRPDWEQLVETAGGLYRLGQDFDWAGFHARAPGRRIALPPTPFQRKRSGVERPERAGSRLVGQGWTYAPQWRPVRPNVDAFGARGQRPILILADAGGLGEALAERQQRRAVVVRAGDGYALSGDRGTVDPDDPAQLARLVQGGRTRADRAPLGARRRGHRGLRRRRGAAPGALRRLRAAGGGRRRGRGRDGVARDPRRRVGGGRGARAAPGAPAGPRRHRRRGAAGPGRGAGRPRPVGRGLARRRADAPRARAQRRRPRGAARRPRRHALRAAAGAGPGAGHQAPAIRADGTYLVTGGLGAIGRQVARWLVGEGAGAVVLTTRRERDDQAELLDRLGERASVILGDVAEDGEVDRILAEIARRGLPPVQGVFHAAGVLDDGWIADLGPDRWVDVLRPSSTAPWRSTAPCPTPSCSCCSPRPRRSWAAPARPTTPRATPSSTPWRRRATPWASTG
ncbi:MAG: SDR family NAD(P)-dependent oxidoreductase [Myxococcota bacterium]